MQDKAMPSAVELLERDFLECRSRLLDVAALLDRIDRHDEADRARKDFRYHAIAKILEVICSDRQDRTAEILTALSDPTAEPGADRMAPDKALGAWRQQLDH